LVPKQLEEHGLKPEQLTINDDALEAVINYYTREAGVRNLERQIASVIRGVAVKVAEGNEGPFSVAKREDIPQYLGPERFTSEVAERTSEPGVATGLAWTSVGGEILFIEATRMPGKGRLTLTGSLGDVMKESAQAALSYLRSQSQKLHLNLADSEQQDLHIHVPAGATPKDGPSAGVTIVAALASLLTKRLLKSDLAMTGEISLRGRVLRVGGIKEKVMAAARSGMKEVILPQQNKNDWTEVPAEVRKKLKAHFVDHISDLIKIALQPRRK